jgi:hypothetical protein
LVPRIALAELAPSACVVRELIWSRAVLKRMLLLAVALACVATNDADLRGASVEVHIYPLTGDVRLLNPNATQFDFIYYELTSAASAFSSAPAAWNSIADTYDASGSGFVDPVNQWLELSGTSSMLAEGLFVGSGSRLPAFRSISLGQVWDAQVVMPNDVAAAIFEPSLQLADVAVQVALAGDYNHDLVVDAMDYTEWRSFLGSQTDPHADGNFDGIVDAADYTVWRDNFGLSIAGAGFGSLTETGSLTGGTTTVAPEPTSILLALVVGAGLLLGWRSR